MKLQAKFLTNQEVPNIMKEMQDAIVQRITKEFNQKLEDHLKSCLKKMGFEFKTQTELINFCIERVQRIIRGNQHTFYLDYVDNENKGIIIGGYNSSIIFSMEGFTAKSSIDYRFF